MSNREIVRMKFGSHLYGTNTPKSDTDIKAVHIPDPKQIILGSARVVVSSSTGNNFDKNSAEDIDSESFTLQHFLKLLMDGQTVCLDMLYAPDHMIEYMTEEWQFIRNHRQQFLSKQCQSFLGYCKQQANKYGIKGSRVAAVRAVVNRLDEILDSGEWSNQTKVEVFEWEDFVRKHEHTEIVNIANQQGNELRHLSVCNRKVPFTANIKQAREIYGKLLDQYGQRAVQAESNEGVDWKALSHAVRVGRQAIDVLSGRDIIFPLPYADHLLKIKTGQLDYAIVSEEIEQLLEQVEAAAANSPLPEFPNKELAMNFVEYVYGQEVAMYTMIETSGYPRFIGTHFTF